MESVFDFCLDFFQNKRENLRKILRGPRVGHPWVKALEVGINKRHQNLLNRSLFSYVACKVAVNIIGHFCRSKLVLIHGDIRCLR